MGAVVTSMDWSPIIAGGITGLLSGAISGNLVQYVLDKRRKRNKNRHQLLMDWDGLLNNDSLSYDHITTHKSYELLTSFISPKSRCFLETLITETEDERQALQVKIKDYYEFYDDEICTLGDDTHSQERFWLIDEGASDWHRSLRTVEQDAKQAVVSCLKRELLLLKKKWGMF